MSAHWLDWLQYYGAAAGTLAALIVALDLGRRETGFGFCLFVTSSIALIGWGFFKPDSEGIGWQNVALLIINLTGVYRYLIRKPSSRRSTPKSARPEAGLPIGR
jgi:hypothetical protein